MAGTQSTSLRDLFLGRDEELHVLRDEIDSPDPKAVLIVGQPGMGKSRLVERLADLMSQGAFGVPGGIAGGVVKYEVTANQSPQAIMASMVRDAYEAAKTKPFFTGDERKWQALLTGFEAIPLVGTSMRALAELIASLPPDERRDSRQELLARFSLISEKMPDQGRAVFVIDAAYTLHPHSDQEWSLVVRDLPPKITLIFTQRPDDEIARSAAFRELIAGGRARRLDIDVIDRASIDEMVRQYAITLHVEARELAGAVDRFERHPYAVHAALEVIAGADPLARRDEIERVKAMTDPTPMGVARMQIERAAEESGAEGRRVLEAYAVLDAPAPEGVVCVVAGVDAAVHRTLLDRRYFSTLLRESAGGRDGPHRAIYHAILADTVRERLGEDGSREYHQRALAWFRERLVHARTNPSAEDGYPASRFMSHATRILSGMNLAVVANELAGRTFHRLGQLAEAEGVLRQAMAACPDDDTVAAVCLGNLGIIEFTRGNLPAAEEYQTKALAIDERDGNQEGMAATYGNLGLIEQTRGNLDAAEGYHKKALAINEKLGNQEGVAANYGNLGLIEMTRENLDAAEGYHKQALAIEEKLGNQEGMAIIYGNLGLIEKIRGNLGGAEEYHKKSLASHEKRCHLEGMAIQHANLGSIATQRGDLARARELWTKSRDLYAKIGVPHMVAQVQGWLDGLPAA